MSECETEFSLRYTEENKKYIFPKYEKSSSKHDKNSPDVKRDRVEEIRKKIETVLKEAAKECGWGKICETCTNQENKTHKEIYFYRENEMVSTTIETIRGLLKRNAFLMHLEIPTFESALSKIFDEIVYRKHPDNIPKHRPKILLSKKIKSDSQDIPFDFPRDFLNEQNVILHNCPKKIYDRLPESESKEFCIHLGRCRFLITFQKVEHASRNSAALGGEDLCALRHALDLQRQMEEGTAYSYFQDIRRQKEKDGDGDGDDPLLGYEALFRCNLPKEFPYPDAFFKKMEETGVAPLITDFVLESIARRKKETDDNYTYSINLSPLEIIEMQKRDTRNGEYHDSYSRYLVEKLSALKLQPENIAIEILERHLNTHSEIVQQIAALKKQGFQIAHDDLKAEESEIVEEENPSKPKSKQEAVYAFPIAQKTALDEMNANRLKIDKEPSLAVGNRFREYAFLSALTTEWKTNPSKNFSLQKSKTLSDFPEIATRRTYQNFFQEVKSIFTNNNETIAEQLQQQHQKSLTNIEKAREKLAANIRCVYDHAREQMRDILIIIEGTETKEIRQILETMISEVRKKEDRNENVTFSFQGYLYNDPKND